MQLSLKQEELQVLIYSSLLHDIGACSDWDEKHFIVHNDSDKLIFKHAETGYKILNKPGKLSKEEFDIIKQHSYYSYNILKGVEGLEKIAFWAGCHHETLDNEVIH